MDTPALKIQKALTKAFKEGWKVRIFYGDTQTGRDWLEESNSIGYVKLHKHRAHFILLFKKQSAYGDVICVKNIVKILALNGEVLYQHDAYHLDELVISQSKQSGYSHEIVNLTIGGVLARFQSLEACQNWLKFIKGIPLKKNTTTALC